MPKEGSFPRALRLGVACVALSVSALSFNPIVTSAQGSAKTQSPVDYPVKPVPFTAVHFDDEFWAPKIEMNRTVTIPYAFQKCEETGRVDNFVRAAASLRGETPANRQLPGYPFDDTDIYKILEGASYSLSVHPDPKLDAYLDSLIAKIGAAQEKDGYLYTARTIDPAHPHPWSGPERWVNEENQSHELYDLGHLYEAAVAHYQATGKRTLLDIAIKSADLLVETFGPTKRKIWPGHEIVEMGLAKLYRVTSNRKYLDLAKFFLDSRGPNGGEYYQAQQRVVDQSEAVGHAVRATYMYSGMADVAALTGDADYVRAIDRIWRNVVDKKLYITGGIGATGAGEAFGRNYQLPNLSAYCETCAAVGNDYWNQRLFLLHADAQYVDVLERTLYNGLISGVGLDGKSFFYPNPLESTGQNQRSPWFGVACCPGNITRFMASIPGYVYAQRGNSLYVNLFVDSSADIKMDRGATLNIKQQTRYPWDGAVKMTVNPTRKSRYSIHVRIPGWARNAPSPGDLYHFVDNPNTPTVSTSMSVNGKPVPIVLDHGYAVVDRDWRRGDSIELNLPMPVRRVAANDQVSVDRGRITLQRGPIVYCAEWPDNPGGHIRNLMLPNDQQLTAEFTPGVLNGVVEIHGSAMSTAYDDSGKVAATVQPFTAIPYYAWANRGRGEMMVWIPDSVESAHPLSRPTIASLSRVTTSRGTNPHAINDLVEPASSGDGEKTFFHWWPRKGTVEWVEYAFATKATVSAASVYWFDDTGRGECRAPKSWRLFYRDGDAWKPVEAVAESAFRVALDRYNRVAFKPVTTTGLRLEVTLQPDWSAGIQQWKVEGVPEDDHSAKGDTTAIREISPPELGFFSKLLDFQGIPIKASSEVSDAALFEARNRIAMETANIPQARINLAKAHVELHIIGKNQQTSDLPEWQSMRGKPFDGKLTIDERTRGMGGRLCSCGEENLLKLNVDRYRGRDICLHEFAHCIRAYGLSADIRKMIRDQYTRSTTAGLWKGAYAATNDDEFFAELTMWYFGTHGDMNMIGPKPAVGPEGLKAYDPEAFKLLDDLYSGHIPIGASQLSALNTKH